jgi:hypothetical protein
MGKNEFLVKEQRIVIGQNDKLSGFLVTLPFFVNINLSGLMNVSSVNSARGTQKADAECEICV